MLEMVVEGGVWAGRVVDARRMMKTRLGSVAMDCPFCSCPDQKVLESRDAREGSAIRRRRECLQCGRRFTTFEIYERSALYVVKRSGGREEFNRQKLLTSMVLACGKRPVSIENLEKGVTEIERDVYQMGLDEIPTTMLGERVMEFLAGADRVAFIRYASVYQEFASEDDFSRFFRRHRSVITGA